MHQAIPLGWNVVQTVPAMLQRQGNFTEFAAIKDPTTGNPFPGNVIPASRINPVAEVLINNYYVPPANNFLSNNSVWFFPHNQDLHRGNWPFFRIDHKVTNNSNLYVRYMNRITPYLVALCAACHSGLGDGGEADVHGNQVGLLRQSQCYRNSPGMSCSTCHNVHRVERDLEALAARCATCHTAPRRQRTLQADQNCIDCHMPRREFKVITFRTSGSLLAQQYRTHKIAIYLEQAQKQPPREAARVQSGPQFSDVAAAGIAFRHENGASPEKHMFETFGSGVGVIDFDNDGWPDLFFANGADLAHGKRSPGNALYRNLGNGMFATGVTVGAYDNAGVLDLYVTGYGGNQLFHNNGNGTFTDVTAKAGVGASGWSSSAAWVDYDRDGLPGFVRGPLRGLRSQNRALLRLPETGLSHVLRPSAV